MLNVAATPTVSSAISQTWQPGKAISTARDLNQACSSTNAGKVACVYFVNGVLNDIETEVMVTSKRTGKPVSPPFCLTPGVSLDNQLAAITSTITATPKLASAPASYLVRYVYGHSWPCKATAAQ